MKEHDEDELKKLLQRAMPRVAAEAEPERDLWPAVLKRLDAEQAAPPWFDWALLGGLVAFVAVFPAVIPLFLYYL
jgi:hypothetical protein